MPVLKAFGQALRMGYLRLEYIHQQAFVTTASGDYLDWHGIQAGGLSRNPPSFAQGPASSSAVTLGTVVPDGTVFSRTDGQLFISVGTKTATAIPIRLTLRAQVAGELGNTDVGATLVPQTPIAGLASVSVDTGGLIGGKASESDDSFRQRILFHKQNPPHGGSPAEYVEWCQTKIGVTRVFVQRATPAPGSVTIYFMMDGIGTGIPNAADVDQLQAILEGLAPADANVIVGAPTTQAVNITVASLRPDTAVMREAVVTELKAQFLRKAEPASVIAPSIFARSWIDEAVAMAPGWQRSSITAPSADVVIATPGVIPILGAVTFA